MSRTIDPIAISLKRAYQIYSLNKKKNKIEEIEKKAAGVKTIVSMLIKAYNLDKKRKKIFIEESHKKNRLPFRSFIG